MDKKLSEYQLGEELSKSDTKELFGVFDESIKKPIRLVKITWTFQDMNTNQMDYSLKHKSCIEEEEIEDEEESEDDLH